MRYYDILITRKDTGETIRHWSSLDSNYRNDPSALKITFDILVYSGQAAAGGSILNIYGVSLEDLFHSNDLYGDPNGAPSNQIIVRGGMTKGLPLADPSQSGVLFSGVVFQSFANWVGTDMSLSIALMPSPYTSQYPGNFVLDWRKGQKLSDALTETFNRALPGFNQSINIRTNIVAPSNHQMVAPTLDVLAQQLHQYTTDYFPESPAVNMGIHHGAVIVWDGTVAMTPIQIQFTDLVGQPTWIGPRQLEFVTQLRSDISIGDTIKMPKSMASLPGFVQTREAAYPSYNRYQSTFTGEFVVQQVRHIGDNRSPSGGEWASVFIALASGSGAGG